MVMRLRRAGWVGVGASLAVMALAGLVAAQPSAHEVMAKVHLAMYYPGEDMKARVMMRLISRDGAERIREMTMLRKDLQEGGEQRYFIYFHRPPDVRDMTFMVWKYPGRDSDRWLYIPALKLVRRIAANDKRSSFVGSDFSYEDVSGRPVEDDTHKMLKEEKVGGQDVFMMESVPKEPGSVDFNRKVSWINKATWLPVKEEYYDRRGDLMKVFTADDMKEIEGFWTIVRRTMRNVQTGHRTEATYQETRYNLKLSPDLFTERSLRAPPPELVR